MGYKGYGGRGRKGALPAGVLNNNLTGQKFGMLKVHKYIGGKRWLCDCDCGNPMSKIIRTQDLVRGKHKSCGCIRAEQRERAASRREARAYANPTGKRGRSYGWGSVVGALVNERGA